MTKTIIVAALALALASEASAQSRTYYDKGGNVTGKSATDSQGTTTFYDASGKVTGRTSTGSGGTTTIYDFQRTRCRALHHGPATIAANRWHSG